MSDGDDLDRLGEIDVGHVIGVVGDDLVHAAQRREARRGRILGAGRVVVFPRLP